MCITTEYFQSTGFSSLSENEHIFRLNELFYLIVTALFTHLSVNSNISLFMMSMFSYIYSLSFDSAFSIS